MTNKIIPINVVDIIIPTILSLAGPYVGDAVGDSVGAKDGEADVIQLYDIDSLKFLRIILQKSDSATEKRFSGKPL